jgi:hypothetical protein
MSGAREAVARALYRSQMAYMQGSCREWDDLEPELQSNWLDSAADSLAILAPIIAAEIRRWADEEIGSVASIGPVGYIQGQLDCLEIVVSNSDAIASRICGEGEQ